MRLECTGLECPRKIARWCHFVCLCRTHWCLFKKYCLVQIWSIGPTNRDSSESSWHFQLKIWDLRSLILKIWPQDVTYHNCKGPMLREKKIKLLKPWQNKRAHCGALANMPTWWIENSIYMKLILTKKATFITIIYHTKSQFAKMPGSLGNFSIL